MIFSFADALTKQVFHGLHTPRVRKLLPSSELLSAAERRLDLLNSVENMESLSEIPALHTEVVRDGREMYSIPINKDHRITFRWNDGNAHNVEIK